MAITTVASGETRTTQQILTGTDRLTVEAGGTISVTDSAHGVSVHAAVKTVITNAGLIESENAIDNNVGGENLPITGDLLIVNEAGGTIRGFIEGEIGGAGIRLRDDLGGADVTIRNSGTIGSATSGTAIKLEDAGNGGRIVIDNREGGLITSNAGNDVVRGMEGAIIINAGTIRSADDNIAEELTGGDAIDLRDLAGQRITNSGLIEASRHGITGERGATIVNEAEGVIVGRNGSGLNFDNDGAIENAIRVTNHGLIQGKVAGYEEGDGDAIDTDGLLFLNNHGRIEGLGAAGLNDGEINVSEALAIGGGTVNNHADGVIFSVQRAIQVDDSANGAAPGAFRLVNAGRIEALDGEAIRIVGDQHDTIVNTGVIIGDVLMDGGNDKLTNTGGVISGLIDMGTGDDTMIGGNGVDIVFGFDGNDRLEGRAGTDLVYGEAGDDQLLGGTGHDQLFGGTGADVIMGGTGNDTTRGDAGNDTIVGGNGIDVAIFAFDAAEALITAIRDGNGAIIGATIRHAVEGGIERDVVREVEVFAFNDGAFTLAGLFPAPAGALADWHVG